MSIAIRIILIVVVLALQPVLAQDTQKSFPRDYMGIYKGTLRINGAAVQREFPMEFHLAEGDSTGHYRYTLVYGEGDNKQVRAYNLIAEDPGNGKYIIDENNGIILDDRVIENRMYSLFEVGGNLLTTFITFHDDHMLWEIAVAVTSDVRTTETDDEDQTEVKSYPITTVQRAVLKKQ